MTRGSGKKSIGYYKLLKNEQFLAISFSPLPFVPKVNINLGLGDRLVLNTEDPKILSGVINNWQFTIEMHPLNLPSQSD